MPRAAKKLSPQDPFYLIAVFLDTARRFAPRERVEAVMRAWIPKRDRDVEGLSEKRVFAMTADAMVLAGDLTLSLPSASGATAFDRLAKRMKGVEPAQAAAVSALAEARFRLLRVESEARPRGVMARDLLSGEVLRVELPALPPLGEANYLFARVADAGEGKFCLAGAVVPRIPFRPGSRAAFRASCRRAARHATR